MPNQGASGEALGTFLNQFFTSSTERKQHMAALQALVVNPAVAQAVVDRMGVVLPKDVSPDVLLRSVNSRLVSGTDLIEVSVNHADPQVALQLADAWAEAYVTVVSDVYGDVPLQQRQALAEQLQQARGNYDKAEAAWEDALRQDRFDSLSRDLATRQVLLQALSGASGSAWAQLVEEVTRMERLLADVQALQAQIKAGGHAEANASSLLVLKTRALTSLWEFERVASQPLAHPADADLSDTGTSREGVMLPESASSAPIPLLQLQSAVPDMTAQEISTELQRLDESLQSRLASLKQALEAAQRSLASGSGSQPVGAGSSELVSALERQIRDLRVQLAQEESRLRIARSERDRAWQAYQDSAAQETGFARALASQQQGLRIAAPARLYDPSASGRTDRLLSGGIVGLIMGVLVALALGWLRRSQTS